MPILPPYNEENLRRMYLDEGKSTTQIAAELGLSHGAGGIYRALKRYGIPVRSKSDSVARSWVQASESRREATAANMRKQTALHYERGVTTRAAQYREKPTPSEQLVIDYLNSIGEPFEFQVQFGVYIADFVLRHRGLVLEIDSLHHRTPSIAERDQRRDATIAEQGLRTVRVAYWTSGNAKRNRFLREVYEAITQPA